MPLRVARRLPVFTVHRATVLNDALSPTARLLYVVLLASPCGDLQDEQLERLSGMQRGRLATYVAELEAYGLVSIEPGEDGEPEIQVHEEPDA
ncbi:hypothetical protein [Actinacidiphila acidipaludis]|uniref:SPOC domain-containing protein n=1 Tax=Actinacidiphila acidipaludis TaxID=2873382 RepID=A0ABS7QHS4_9ACTN|nr:hypothetical protein [Streptomyces acidipaludis]MBY8882727.1 hypothetical protein [Streptomyces acidipaludis]